jgi:hypothetical protein
MHKSAILVLFLATGAMNPDVAFASTRSQSDVVAECKIEANGGHGKLYVRHHTQAGVWRHQKRMRDICEAWLTVGANERDHLLAECDKEAARMVATYRGWLKLRRHVDAKRAFCKELYILSAKN